jgi:hypothetical protein
MPVVASEGNCPARAIEASLSRKDMTMDEALQPERQNAQARRPAAAGPDAPANAKDVDAQWIRQSRSGDAQAFARLVNRHQGRLVVRPWHPAGR